MISAGPVIQTEPNEVDLLIRNTRVYRSDGTFTTGHLTCNDGLVVSVDEGDPSPADQAKKTIDAGGGIVHPGLTDAHFHAPLLATRGVLDTRGSRDTYFRKYVEWFDNVDEEVEYLSTLVACTEALAHGVTAFVEPGTAMEPDAVAAAASEVGVRCSLGDSFVWDRADFWMATAISRRPLAKSTAGLGSQLWRNQDLSQPLITGHVAIYGSASASASLLADAADCAKENDTFLTLHQSPTEESAALDKKHFGSPALEFMNEVGVLTDDLLLAHVNYLSGGEESALASSATTVAWCPANAINWGVAAHSSLPRLLAGGSRIALGSDLPKTWSLSDQVSLATIQARSVGIDLEPDSIYDAVFCHVRRLMRSGVPEPGVESGTVADLVIRQPMGSDNDLINHMAVAKSATIKQVIVNGELVYDAGPTRADPAAATSKLMSKARAIAARL